MKTRKMYQVRYYRNSITYSDTVGFKGRLVDYKTARKIVRRLVRAGVEAFHASYQIAGEDAERRLNVI